MIKVEELLEAWAKDRSNGKITFKEWSSEFPNQANIVKSVASFCIKFLQGKVK